MPTSITTSRTEPTGTVHVTAEDDGHVYLEATPADEDAGRIAMHGANAIKLADALGNAAREVGYEDIVHAQLPPGMWLALIDAATFSLGGRGEHADHETAEALDELRASLGLAE